MSQMKSVTELHSEMSTCSKVDIALEKFQFLFWGLEPAETAQLSNQNQQTVPKVPSSPGRALPVWPRRDGSLRC